MSWLRRFWRWLTRADIPSAAEVEQARREFLGHVDALDAMLAREQERLRARSAGRHGLH